MQVHSKEGKQSAEAPATRLQRAGVQFALTPGVEPHWLHHAEVLHLQRWAGNESVSSLLQLQRAPDVHAAAPGSSVSVDVVEGDIRSNKSLYLNGLIAAANRFIVAAHAELEAEKIEDTSRLWIGFGKALVSLALPLLYQVVLLNPVGMALFVGTVSLLMDPALDSLKGKSKEPDLEKAITDYFIGPLGSVFAAIDGIDSKTAAADALERHKEIDAVQLRIAISRELFQPEALEGYEVKAAKVNAHANDAMMRLWSLQTVADRAQAAFLAHASPGDDMTAYLDELMKVFPDSVEKMEKYMPERHHYWFGEKNHHGKEYAQFKRDIKTLAQLTSRAEFGTALL
jgi:hypothetical protein